MRIVYRMIMMLCAAGWALAGVRDVVVHKSSGIKDTTLAVNFDSMTIANSTDLRVHVKTGPAKLVALSLVDSVTFPYSGGPACKVLAPNGGETYHVGDSLMLRWRINPPAVQAAGSGKVAVLLSLDGGNTYSVQLDLGILEPQVRNDDTRYNSNHEMVVKWKITAPMTKAISLGSALPASPISSACKIKVGVYDHYFERENSDESGVFAIE